MSFYRKACLGMVVLALAVGTVLAAPTGPFASVKEETPGMTHDPALYDAANTAKIISTGFEPPEWDPALPDMSICGAKYMYGVTCFYPVSNVCVPGKGNYAANQNCCPDATNELNNWSMSPSSRQCREPEITTAHPFAGAQHLRFARDALGGLPAGCVGMGSACRERFIAQAAHRTALEKVTWSYEIAISETLGMNMVNYFGQDTGAGSISIASYHLWYYTGELRIYSFTGYTFVSGGYWLTIPAGEYRKFEVVMNPCDNTATYSYGGVQVFQEPYVMTLPYGDWLGIDLRPATLDEEFATTDSYPPATIDIDDHFLTYEPCTDACCNGVTGTCTDILAADQCGGRRYVNTRCSLLGTGGDFGPTCALDTGSCCNSSAGLGGACTVTTEAGCPVDAQHAWVRGGSCTGTAAIAGACHVGKGKCVAGFCQTWPHVGLACAVSADCNVAGFCSAGNVGALCMVAADCDVAAVPAAVCEEHTGSCCTEQNGACTLNMLRADCEALAPSLQPRWTKLGDCTGCTADTGACCDTDTFGGCTVTTFAGCQGGKLNFSKGQTCAEITCTHEAIPTVSEWGIVVLTLLLLTGAKVYFGRRQAVA